MENATLSVITTSTQTVSTTISFPQGAAVSTIAASPFSGTNLYVGSPSIRGNPPCLYVINTLTSQVYETIQDPTFGQQNIQSIVISAHSNQAYVVLSGNASHPLIAVIDAQQKSFAVNQTFPIYFNRSRYFWNSSFGIKHSIYCPIIFSPTHI